MHRTSGANLGILHPVPVPRDPAGAAVVAAAVTHILSALDCLGELVERTDDAAMMRFLVDMADHLEDARQDAVMLGGLLGRSSE